MPTSSSLKPKSPQDSQVIMTEAVLPQHTNSLGSIFGGVLMSWIDIAAAIAAQRHSGRTCVTASIDELHFLRPIRLGYVVNITARVSAVHRTSCEVHVEVEGENPRTGERYHTSTAFLTFVALDEHGKPVQMPPLAAKTAEDKKLAAHGLIRRDNRMKLKKLLQKRS